MIPIGALLDVQYRLYQYGHGVQNDARSGWTRSHRS